MPEKNDDEHLEKPIDKQSENPAVEETSETESIQETETMEVHHHAHHEGKKNWKSYFWEFLMLFLAVFCGFLAEYQLEHKIERERAEELAKSFYYELRQDSATASLKVENRIKQENALRYMSQYFRDSSLVNPSKAFEINFSYGVIYRTPSIFEPRTAILEQLKNSGSLRYFKNEELQSLIGELTVTIKNIYDRQDLEGKVRIELLNPMMIRLSDYNFDDYLKRNTESVFEGMKMYEASNEFFPYHIDKPENFDAINAARELDFYRANVIQSTRIIPIKKYQEINAAIMKILREEYDLH